MDNQSFQPKDKVTVISGKYKGRAGIISPQVSDQENMVWVYVETKDKSSKFSHQSVLLGFNSIQKITL